MRNIGIVFSLLAVLIPVVGHAGDVSTIQGSVYSNATVLRVEPDGLNIRHSSGIAKVFFWELPREVAAKYGYRPERASAYQKKVAAARADYEKKTASLPTDLERRAQEVGQQQVVATAAQPQERGKKVELRGTVFRVLDNGIILHNVALRTSERFNSTIEGLASSRPRHFKSGGKTWKRYGEMVFISTDTGGYVDGAVFSAVVRESGIYNDGYGTYKAYTK